MSQDVSKQTRLLVVSIVVIAAILMVAVLPFLVPDMLDKIQHAQQARYEKFLAEGNPQAPLIQPTMELTGWTYPLYMSISMFAGIILLFISKALYNGQKWAKALTLLCLAMPSIGGAYMLVPYLNFVGEGVPPSLFYMATGLIPYFIVLLVDIKGIKLKLVNFWVFLLLGVTSAEAWSNGHAAHRILQGHPAQPFYAEGIFILQPARNISWIAVIFLVAAIYLLSLGKKSGWYAALFGAANAGLIGFATQFVRTATYDYLYQGLMGLAIVATLLIPLVKSMLVDKDTSYLIKENNGVEANL